MSPSSAAYMRHKREGQKPQRDEDFHHAVNILEHIWYVDGVIKVL